MILILSQKFAWRIAYFFSLVFLLTLVPYQGYGRSLPQKKSIHDRFNWSGFESKSPVSISYPAADMVNNKRLERQEGVEESSTGDIDGPSQPEMASFQSVGTNNMVNLFTGDFSYNIPLLDVGGYPVNIFYSGGIGMEQDASWVGLGWNINPGAVSRNMRGIPDDFNGTEKLTQIQAMKPNRTWGINLNVNVEKFGESLLAKIFLKNKTLSLGYSYNNYLGPSIELGFQGSISLSVLDKVKTEKDGKTVDTTRKIGSVGGSLGLSFNSRSGLSISPNVSLSATHNVRNRQVSHGLTMATSYNSRTGIRALQLNEQSRFNMTLVKRKHFSVNMSPGIGGSSSITFARPTYIPTVRMPVTNTAFSGNLQLGAGIFGGYVAGQAEVYFQKAEVKDEDTRLVKPMIGYMYYQNARNNPQALMDFSRLNDGAVTANSTIISAPQYAYDVFSIQGEGTGGSVRAYRYDDGYVRDNETRSRDKSLALGADIGWPGHIGVNFNQIKTPSIISEWQKGNKLRNAIAFRNNDKLSESVYFRNPGETSVLDENEYTRLGNDSLVRFKLGGTNANPSIEPVLQKFDNELLLVGETNLATAAKPSGRAKRSQVISFLTASEAAAAGLDRYIRSYRTDSILGLTNSLKYDSIRRVSEYRLAHHISQINVTEPNGMRYVYGIPVYNVVQRDFTFTLANTTTNDSYTKDKIAFTSADTLLNNAVNSDRDGYYQQTQTPAYSHSFLLSGLLSPDYVDVHGDGITEDDLGSAVKFNYTRIKQGSDWKNHQWRTPLGTTMEANFNAGAATEVKDDKAVISYGERESWYLHSIESKTMIAIFTLGNRQDGKGASDVWAGIDAADNSLKKLERIDLYSKSDLKENGLTGAKPIKSVHFSYSYGLCEGVPGNAGSGGKLTLDSIYFTFNGQNRANKSKYAFAYSSGTDGNPDYDLNASDRWGNYKPKSMNPARLATSVNLRNAEFPYTIQDADKRDRVNEQAGAWSLNKILLPSGGQIEVLYESDDYAFVQDKRSAVMMQVLGFGKDATAYYPRLYTQFSNDFWEHDHAFIKVPVACANKQEVFQRYIQGLDQLMVKMAVNMPKGVEFIPAYAKIVDYGVYDKDGSVIWVKAERKKGRSPFSLAAIEYLREQLPGQAYAGYDVSGEPPLTQIVEMFKGIGEGLGGAFKDPVKFLRENKGLAKQIVPEISFARLNEPSGYKIGGGHRVKMIKLKDHWKSMTGQDSSVYGQIYDYTTTEIFNGHTRRISSGVASYEPGLGSDENPLQRLEMVADKLPLGPTSYGAIELPFLDAFFPAPLVGYSKVTVRTLRKGSIDTSRKARSAIGKQVTEFYTARDFPYTVLHTSLDPSSNKIEHAVPFFSFLKKRVTDRRAISQGFLVVTNDMHGKMKSQSSFTAMDSVTPINYTENFYRNTGRNGMGDYFDFVHAKEGGVIRSGRMGVDIELMTDTREFSVTSKSIEAQLQVDLFPVFFPFWLPFPWDVGGESENTYRAVTTTKLVNFHALLDSVLVIDKGSQVSTKNLIYDSETGQVVVTRTNNEFNQPVYNTSYPAYWAYSGMGPAYRNIDAVYRGVDFLAGKIVSDINEPLSEIFESGDEILLLNDGYDPGDECGAELKSDTSINLLWAFDRDKQASSLTNTSPDFIFLDSAGKPYTRYGMDIRIVRSGKRNMLGQSLASATTQLSPIAGTTIRTLEITGSQKVINASAAEFREKWQIDNSVVKTLIRVYDENNCESWEEENCEGYLEKNINPYRKGLLGNFRIWRSLVYYDNREDSSTALATNISDDGFLKSDFAPYWEFDELGNLKPAVSNDKWVWNSQITRVNHKGMELETKDALNIYTAAQYGYQHNLPIAIANNARYQEIAFGNFEDEDYQSSINNARYTLCAKPTFDFFGFTNSAIKTSTETNFPAHTGKSMLAVYDNQTAELVLPVSVNVPDSFSLAMGMDMLKDLANPGGNSTKLTTIPSSAPANAPSLTISNFGMNLDFGAHNVVGQLNGSTVQYYLQYRTTQYMEITDAAKYAFTLTTNITDAALGYPPTYITKRSDILLKITNVNTQEELAIIDISNSSSPYTDSVFLPCDQYKVECLVSADIQRAYNGTTGFHQFHASFGFTSNTGVTSYRNLLLKDLCEYTLPIKADTTMFNPVFTLEPEKEMLFSAWVKEVCATPCSTYSNNKVEIQYTGAGGGTIELRPSGPIIEGWQRYEGIFKLPSGATGATLKLVNLSESEELYVDDIRIHPFNANMKSYVYDPVSLRLLAELDPNNYARYYEYDEEGTLIRTKAETKNGIKTITESRSAKQKDIRNVDPD